MNRQEKVRRDDTHWICERFATKTAVKRIFNQERQVNEEILFITYLTEFYVIGAWIPEVEIIVEGIGPEQKQNKSPHGVQTLVVMVLS